MPEPRSNALIVRAANPARLALVRSLVARLDQPAAPGSSAASGNIHVVYLKNADAVKLAATLRAALQAGNLGAGAGTIRQREQRHGAGLRPHADQAWRAARRKAGWARTPPAAAPAAWAPAPARA
ncbi:general secretion pathway protein D [Alicycliphilus sp. B1]|nr:general secretion pathway protein D [Alicycliphilus sp. B1]